MNPNIRGVLFAAVSLLLLAAACGPAPTYQPPAQAPSDTPVSGIPVSAADIGYRAFFCERNVSYGVLSLPASVSFEVSPQAAGVACTRAETFVGRQIVLCHGPSLSSFNLRVCSGPGACVDAPVNLFQCPPPTLMPTETPTETPTASAIPPSPEASPTAPPIMDTETATTTP